LEKIENNKTEKPKCCRQAAGIRTYFEKFESVFLAVFWTTVLERFEKTNTKLQATITNVKNVVDLYNSLIDFVSQLRTDEKFQEFVDEAKRMKGEDSEEYEYDLKRTRVRYLACDETRENEFIFTTGKHKFKVEVYFAALDKLHCELQSRCSGYVKIFEKYKFPIKYR